MIELLKHASLWLTTVGPDAIEIERQRLEAEHKRGVLPYDVQTVTMSGARCTRVLWEVRANEQT